MTLRLHRIYDGSSGWFIRGTADPAEAETLANGDVEILDYLEEDAPEDMDWEVQISVERAGWFRFNPCSPRSCGEHGWHLGDASKPGRGVFPGVAFDVRAVPVVFDSDLDMGLVDEAELAS